MTDFDYWKHRYSHTWDQSSRRENNISLCIKQLTGFTVVKVGLGAGSSDFIPGPAMIHGLAKGEADLQVEGTNIFLEVTGPLVKSVTPEKPIWVRPDKLDAARNHQDHETWILHHLPYNELVRVINLDSQFWSALDRGEFIIVQPIIRGVMEKYYEIPASHHCVQPFDSLIARLGRKS